MVEVERNVIKRIKQVCLQGLPHEVCGILWGHADEGKVRIHRFTEVENSSSKPQDSFLFNPKQWIDALYRKPRGQEHIIGIFHSHPSGSALPSEEDRRHLAVWQFRCYMIISCIDRANEIRIYRWHPEQGIQAEPLQVCRSL